MVNSFIGQIFREQMTEMNGRRVIWDCGESRPSTRELDGCVIPHPGLRDMIRASFINRLHDTHSFGKFLS